MSKPEFISASDAEALPVQRSPAGAHDPLLAALLLIASHHGRPISPGAVLTGLPLADGRLTASLMPRAAERACLEASAVSRPLLDIPNLVLPAILILVDSVAVLFALDRERGVARIVDAGRTVRTLEEIPLAQLSGRYAGFAIFLRPRPAEAGRGTGVAGVAAANWFWAVVARFRSSYLHIALASLIINVLALAFPLFVMAVYDRVLPNFAISSLVALAVGVVIAVIFDMIMRITRSRMIDMTGKQADVMLASSIFGHVLGLKAKVRPHSVGTLANQLRDFDSVREFFTSSTLISATDIVFAGIFIAILFLIVGPLAWVPMVLLPIVLAIGLIIQRPLDRATKALQSEAAARHGILVEALANFETVKTLSAEGRMQAAFERSVAASARAAEAVHYWSSLALMLSNAAQQIAQLIVIVWGVFLVMGNVITVGALVAANMLIGRILGPVTNLATLLTRASLTAQSLAAIDQIMRLENERPRDRTFVARDVSRGEIAFKDVTFRYPGAKKDALAKVSFTIRAGERVGVIGRIGSGKTTIGRLISGLYEPDEGAVLIDGVDARQYDPADLRAGVGFVLQDVQLFLGSLRENVVVGHPSATDAEVVEAGRLAGLERLISEHPDGYEMQIAEGGRSLSGGQRQAVALARVLIRSPRVLFMDEPTSALDQRSEAEFCERINTMLGRDVTFIVATHRTSLLRFVDRLMVFEEGRLIADGPREAILARMRGDRAPVEGAV